MCVNLNTVHTWEGNMKLADEVLDTLEEEIFDDELKALVFVIRTQQETLSAYEDRITELENKLDEVASRTRRAL